MKSCPSCGCQINESLSTCPKCGATVRKKDDQVPSFYQTENNTEERKWFFIENGESVGPRTVSEMKKIIEIGRVTSQTLVYTKSSPEKVKVSETELAAFLKKIEKPVTSVNDTTAWLLAVVPSAIEILLYVIAFLAGIDSQVIIGILLIYITSIGFYLWDMNYLKKNSSAYGAWVWLGIILTPLYLFMRASKTKKKYGYAIANLILIAATSSVGNLF